MWFRLELSFKQFESQKYCAMQIVKEIIVFIYGKDQLRKNWYLITLKRLFTTWFRLTIKCTYLFVFILEQHIPKKADFSQCRKNTYLINKTV